MTDALLAQSTQNSDGRLKLSLPSTDARWIATLSDGSTIVENTEDWSIKPGEPLPWVRLCHFTADNNLHLTSLRLNYKGRTIHLPRAKFDKFGLDAISPLYYSLAYKVEAEMNLGGGAIDQTLFVDLVAHYQDFEAHYIQNVTTGNESWVVVTENLVPLAKTPQFNGEQ